MASPLRLLEINWIKTKSVAGLPNWTKMNWTYTSLYCRNLSPSLFDYFPGRWCIVQYSKCAVVQIYHSMIVQSSMYSTTTKYVLNIYSISVERAF